jgi:hypothetical protein
MPQCFVTESKSIIGTAGHEEIDPPMELISYFLIEMTY